MTRAAAAIMIGRALDLNGEQRKTKFPDVGAEQVASGYIASAVAEGIIQGYPDGTYRPNETVTRGQMAIFLSRAFDLTVEAMHLLQIFQLPWRAIRILKESLLKILHKGIRTTHSVQM